MVSHLDLLIVSLSMSLIRITTLVRHTGIAWRNLTIESVLVASQALVIPLPLLGIPTMTQIRLQGIP